MPRVVRVFARGVFVRGGRAVARVALLAAAATPAALFVVAWRLGDVRDREAPFWVRAVPPRA